MNAFAADAGQLAYEAGQRLERQVEGRPDTAAIAWSTERMVDGRFLQVTLYLGRVLRPAVGAAFPQPAPLGADDLPHYPAQGELLLS